MGALPRRALPTPPSGAADVSASVFARLRPSRRPRVLAAAVAAAALGVARPRRPPPPPPRRPRAPTTTTTTRFYVPPPDPGAITQIKDLVRHGRLQGRRRHRPHGHHAAGRLVHRRHPGTSPQRRAPHRGGGRAPRHAVPGARGVQPALPRLRAVLRRRRHRHRGLPRLDRRRSPRASASTRPGSCSSPTAWASSPTTSTSTATQEWCQPTAPGATPAERYRALNGAVDRLTAHRATKVYLDGTHSAWLGVGDIAHRLVKAGVQRASGFFLNVSNFQTTSRQLQYGTWISECIAYATAATAARRFKNCASQYYPADPNDESTWYKTDEWYAANLGGAVPTTHFVIDTSRNGQGPWTGPPTTRRACDPEVWCNPPGRGLGLRPTTRTGNPLADAFLWIKTPGQSDGQCKRGTAGPDRSDPGHRRPAGRAVVPADGDRARPQREPAHRQLTRARDVQPPAACTRGRCGARPAAARVHAADGCTYAGSAMTTTSPAPTPAPRAAARTYEVRTFGCQMNVHDSERLAGLLEAAGYVRARRRRAGRRRRLQHLRGARERRQQALRQPRPPRAGQGRSAGHADRRRRLPRAEGPGRHRPQGALGRRRLRHPQHRLAAGPARARPAQRGGPGRDPRVARGLPVDAARPGASPPTPPGSPISVGCNNTCTFCIVPSLRGKEKDRRPGRRSSPRSRRSSPRARSRSPCSGRTSTPTASSSATAARSPSCCGPAAAVDGLERVRFTSPHPAAFTDDVIDGDGRDAERHAAAAHAAAVRLRPDPQGDAPLLPSRALPRHPRPGPRRACPTRPSRTDIIVGFPGETEEDFQATLDVVEAARFAQAFTFQYSPRPGTPAATLPDQVPKAVVQERYERLARPAGARSPGRRTARQEGRVLEVLVAEGEGRKDAATAPPVRSRRGQPARALRRCPRAAGRRRAPARATSSPVEVTYGAPHHLVADAALAGGPFAVRRTRAGDAWERRQAGAASRLAARARAGVSLGHARACRRRRDHAC